MSKKYNSKKNMILGNYLKTDFDNHKKETRRYCNTDNEWRENYDQKKDIEKNKDLLKYSFEGNRKMVSIALANGADLAFVDQNGNNCLILAVYSGHFEVVEQIVEFAKKNNKDLDLNYRNNDLISAMHLAVKLNNGKMVKYLSSNGADVNIVGKYRKTPIFEAVENNNDEMIDLLLNLETPADINFQNREGQTPLIVASQNKTRQESFLRLLSNGADMYKTDNQGKTPLMHSCNNNNSTYIDILLKKGNINLLVNVQDNNGASPIMYVAKRGNREALRVLISRGGNIDFADKFGRTAIDYAKLGENPTCVEILEKTKKIYEKASEIEDVAQKNKFLKQNLSVFAKQNRVENSCVK